MDDGGGRIGLPRDASLPIGSRDRDWTARYREWVLLDGDRLALAVGSSLALCLVFVTIELLSVFDTHTLQRTQPLFYLFSALIGGNITLITVVVSISQLLLGRELQPPGELREQIEDVIEYRREVEDATEGAIAPVDPSGFLRLLFENTRQQSQAVGGLLIGARSPEIRADEGLVLEGDLQHTYERIDAVVSSLTEHTDDVLRLLGHADTDVFSVLSTTLTTNYANQINEIRQIRASHGDSLPEAVMEGLDSLIDRLQEIDVARQYFKSIYLQQELAELSRMLLYAGIPAEITSVYALFAFTVPPGTTLLTRSPPVAIPVAVTIGFSRCSFCSRSFSGSLP